jgi:glycosyltransferase involved in cell wall biosynthesis
MKILHILSQRPDATGSGIYLQAMLREAAARGHSNHLVAGVQADWPPELDCIDEDQCRFLKFGKADISYRIVGMSDVMPYDSNRFCDLSPDDLDEYENAFSFKVQEAVDTFRPDLIHSHHLWILSSLVRRLFPHVPMVTTCHGTDLRQFQNCPHLQERVLSGCSRLDAAMALSPAQRDDIVRLYGLSPEKVFVTGAGYNDQLFYAGPKPAPNPVLLVYAGKLARAKGLPWLLQALERIALPEWRLHLVGGGSGVDKADCLAQAQNLGDRVVIHGAVPQVHLAELMRSAHIFLLPSFFEGLPLVLLESLASGCRIIANDLPGVLAILGDVQAEFIHLVRTPPLRNLETPYEEDEEAFVRDWVTALQEQIDAARRRPEIDLSPIAGKMASFSWKGIFEKVEAVYRRVLF